MLEDGLLYLSNAVTLIYKAELDSPQNLCIVTHDHIQSSTFTKHHITQSYLTPAHNISYYVQTHRSNITERQTHHITSVWRRVSEASHILNLDSGE